ncbi:hypothetical protein GUJ93_ZPchr0326g22930 [Zizania palustris]|uniref:Uncharacterized protein n=1 Tax=Zizania palustris TaxID=103762 RepID=A0A8J5QUC9_ZIZPA|nr:hypothetical protein GUJ93_ZPchr0326g22930 [Zizania palustris]
MVMRHSCPARAGPRAGQASGRVPLTPSCAPLVQGCATLGLSVLDLPRAELLHARSASCPASACQIFTTPAFSARKGNVGG